MTFKKNPAPKRLSSEYTEMYDALIFSDYYGISELEYLREQYGDGIIRSAKMSNKQHKSIHGEHCKKIAQLIDFIGQRHNRWTVFSDFLAMAALSLANFRYRAESEIARRTRKSVIWR